MVGSLGAESAWLVVSGHSVDLSITLLQDSESDDSKIRTADAAAD